MKAHPKTGLHDVSHVAAPAADRPVAHPAHGPGQAEANHHIRNGTTFQLPQRGQHGAFLRHGVTSRGGIPQGSRRRTTKQVQIDEEQSAGNEVASARGSSDSQIKTLSNQGSGGNGGDRDRDGGRHERRVLASERWLDPTSSQPGASAPTLTGVISQLQVMMRNSAGAPSQAPRATLTVGEWAQTARNHLVGKGAAPVTLAAVREALLDFSPATWGDQPRGESVRLWLPVFLLNLSRPRTAAQLAQAEATLQLLQRGGIGIGIGKPAGVSTT